MKFARELPAGSPHAARAVIAGKDVGTLAAEVPVTEEASDRDAFCGSAMNRAKLVGLQRNAWVVLGNVAEDSRAR